MNKSLIISATLATLLVSAEGPTGPGAAPAPWRDQSARSGAGADLTEAQAAHALDLVFNSRPRLALAYLDSLAAQSRGEPLYHIMRARCYQELVPMDDANSAASRAISIPALEELDRCINICTARLDAEGENADFYFYRGWAWMAKAYVRSMTRDLFTAGREAKRGKKDLEKYLRSNPDDPTAAGMLGAFLYFADTIPAAFKWLSKLLFLPSGDRKKGLEYLERAAHGGGLLETDWKLILYNVYFFFEGRFEEAIRGLHDMVGLHPGYVRTAIPLALSRPYAPRFNERNEALVRETVNRVQEGPTGEIDWNGLYLVQAFRAYGDRYCRDTDSAVEELRGLIEESPTHPDWVAGFARLELGRIYAARGRPDLAAEMFESVENAGAFDFLRKEARILLDDLDKYAARFEDTPPDAAPWVAALYSGDPDSVRAARPRFEKLAARSAAAAFYVAECDLISGDTESARALFEAAISMDAPAWEHAYQMIAATRIAEIHASEESYETAAHYQSVAMRYYHSEYLLDWVLEGRKKYFERLGDGEFQGPPGLLMTGGGSGGSPGASAASHR